MSPTDPPLPPSPDEPTDEPQWAGDGTGRSASDGEESGPGDVTPPPEPPGDDEPSAGEEGPPEQEEEEVAAGPDTEAAAPELGPGEDEPAPVGEVTSVLPVTGDDLATEPLPATGDDLASVPLPATGDEPTEVIAAGAAASTTGEITRAHRRRVSHRRYVMRRIGVGVVVLALVGGAVFGLVTLLGDDDDEGGGTASTTVATTEAPAVPPATSTSTTTADSAAATTVPQDVATTDAVETSEASAGDPQTTDEPAGTDPSGTDPSGTTDTTSATESSPPGTLVYDLESEATCQIGQTLRSGISGPQVECLQERLNEVVVDDDPYTVDGIFGEQTEQAVRAFQQANGLGVDGIVGPATGEALGIWAG